MITDHALVQEIIDMGLREDIGDCDVTSQPILPPTQLAEAKLTAKAEGIIAGLPIVKRVFHAVDEKISINMIKSDGDAVLPGDLIARLSGRGQSLLTAERLALNFLQRMSGIATNTAEFVRRVRGTRAKIIDTRKTIPGHRILDKYAVKVGGGDNHRMGLYDMVLIKDNHIDVAGGITKAVGRVRSRFGDQYKIEVETRNIEEVQEAFSLNIDRIMLDNMSLDAMHDAVEWVARRVPLEASGGVTLETVREVAKTGVDYISVGELTHSVMALDISMTVIM
ncbi:MAG: nicotinate-nucleotide diphosphorylase (carboxylating) [Candidatus Cloacimonetes bacterium 4572_55]|nr:MAG: nicotinate-nucleotide diphosphorylase (carboxylating) [Candidatus Cloacimonetes bacterium 4572_55]